MAGCSVTAPNGANINCLRSLDAAIAMVILDPSTSWDSVASIDNLETLRVILQETRKGFIVEFNGSEVGAAEATDETTGFGQTITTSISAPTLTGYVKTNACDFVEMLDALDGGTYNVAFFLKGGGLLVVDELQNKDSKLRGFLAQVYALNIGIPGIDNQTQQYRIKVNFMDADEFRKYKLVSVHYGIRDLMELLPLGLTADVVTPYNSTSGEIELQVYTRCSPDDTLSEVLTAEVVGSTQGITVTATPTANGDGSYTVAIAVSATVLSTGEYARFFLCSKDGDIYEKISNIIEVEA